MRSGGWSWARPTSRYLEFDKLVFALLGASFVALAGLLWFLLAAGSGAPLLPVGIVSVVFSALTIGAALLGYKWRFSLPAAALMLFIGLVFAPRAFVIDGLMLRDAIGMPAMRLQVAIGLSIGGVALGFLAFLVVGFIAPLVAAIIAWRRQLPGAVPTLAVKSVIIVLAILVAAVPATDTFKDLWFGLVRPAREAAIRDIQSQESPGGQFTPTKTFPRLACCGNVIRVFEGGDRVLFPMSGYGDGFWAYFYDRSERDDGVFNFRTIRDYGGGWKMVELEREGKDE